VTEPAQRAALAALDNEAELLERVAVLVERRTAVEAGLAERGWTGDHAIPVAQGNFVWLPTGEQTVAAAETLEAHGIVARVFAPDGIRVSIGEPESVETLLRAAAEVVGTLREKPENTGLG
jgi:histidinol-phosphate aminotransferase